MAMLIRFFKIVYLSSLLIAVAQCLHAQEFARQFPVTDPPFASGTVMPAPEGGLLVYYAQMPDRPFIRYDANGAVLWARKYVPSTEVAGHTAMPDGGVVVSGSVDHYFGNTARYSHMRLGPDGEAYWWRRYNISGWPVPIPQAQLTGAAIIVQDNASNVFTVLEHFTNAASGPTVLKCDAAGTLLWAVDLKEQAGITRPLVFANGQGGCYVAMFRNDFEVSGLTIFNLRENGSLIWRRKFIVAGEAPWFSGGVAVTGDATLLVTGWINENAYMLRINENGSLDQALSYPMGPPQTSEGNLHSVHMPDGLIRFGERDVLTFSADGELQSYRHCPTVLSSQGDEELEFMHHIMAGDSYGAVVQGYMRAWIMSPFSMRMGMVAARIPWPELGYGCPFDCSDLPIAQGTPLSNDAFSYFEEPYEGPFPLTTTTTELPIFVSTVPVPETTEFCLTLGMVDPVKPQPVLGVRPNPVAVGNVLYIDVEAPTTWKCTDALGRVIPIEAKRTASGLTMSTSHLEPGHYIILVRSERSSSYAIARFMVH